MGVDEPSQKQELPVSGPNPSRQIQIELDEATAQGIYANLAIVGHTETEFTMDFVYIQPQQPKGRIRARIISNPSHTKRFLMALGENVKKYEKSFGVIKAAQEPEKKVGFSR